ncbi:MAG: alpha/beta fold hydrolase [Myxococcota bacterium]
MAGSSPPPWLDAAGRGLKRAALFAGDMGVKAGRSLAEAYRLIDPDVRRHLAHLPLVGMTHLGPRGTPLRALADDGERPILFVHGLGGHPGNFLPMRAFFRLAGRTRTYAVSFPDGAELPAMAAHLRGVLERVFKVNQLDPRARVDIVAHSMGGIVSRLALADAAFRRRVHTLVTLGTPHLGTHLARLADSPHTRALRPDSVLLRQLEKQLPWKGPPSSPRLVSFWSRSDVLLLPAGTARVRGASNVEVEGFTHLSYLIEPSAWRMVLETLAAPASPRRRARPG